MSALIVAAITRFRKEHAMSPEQEIEQDVTVAEAAVAALSSVAV